mmetsp:Transcript_34253/g.72138  ORF Transcript_34253/g.72138 Transcript_34253/m.72138 type:complete len:221 (+) Transcript_34253:402-1064(+)
MERLARFHRGINIDQIVGLDVLVFVIDGGVDDTVPDRLGDDEFGGGGGGKSEAGGNIGEGDARVGGFEAAESRLDDAVGETGYEGVRAVEAQPFRVGGYGGVKDGQIAATDGLGDLQIGFQFDDHALSEEDAAIGNLSHEKLHHHQETLHGNSKSQSGIGGRLAQRLTQIPVRLRILQPQRLNPSRIVQITNQLIVRRRIGGKVGVAQQFLRLFHLITLQ